MHGSVSIQKLHEDEEDFFLLFKVHFSFGTTSFFFISFSVLGIRCKFFPAVHEVTVSLICFHFPMTLGTNPVTGPRVRIPPRLWDRVDFSKAPLVSFRSKFVLAKRIIHDLLGQT